MNSNILIGEGLVFIIILIIGLFIIFKSKNNNSVDCVGFWSECNSDCTKTYNVVKESKNGGNCESENHKVEWCEPGQGKCLTSIDHSNDKKVCKIQNDIPDHANINDCPNSGVLGHGHTCDYGCNRGYKVVGDPTMECKNGLLQKDNDFKCVSNEETHSSNDCIGYWSDCDSNCEKVYRIYKHATGNGKHCIHNDGEWAPCTLRETSGRCVNIVYGHNHHHNHNYHHIS